MAVFAIVGVLAFLIGLVARAPQGQHAAAAGAAQPAQPRWYELTLALILLAVIAAFGIWLISHSGQWVWGETVGDWRSDTRAIIFAAIMVVLAGVGLAVLFAYALAQSSARPAPRRPTELTAEAPSPSAAVTAAPSPGRILGLLALVAAVVLMCWIGLSPAAQYGLVVQLLYPASLGVTLVLLFDKASRTWGSKGGAETVREWLLCDLATFLLVVAFLNLRGVAKPETYAASFWDILNLVLFFAAFWLIDRTSSRSRFLAGYGYLIVLPLLLLIWDTIQGATAAASWWGSMWPFLILAGVFFLLEVVTLVSSTTERQTLPAIKDAVFVVAYAILLIVAVKSHG